MSTSTQENQALQTDDACLQPAYLRELVAQVAEQQAEFPDLIVALSPLINQGIALPTETALELSIALHDIEAEATQEDALYRLVNQQVAPAIAINKSGSVLALNSAARHLFQITLGDGLDEIGVTESDLHAFQQRLADVAGLTMLKVARPGANTLPMVMIGGYNHRYRAFVLTALQHHWPAAIDEALESLFKLTQSERDVLSCLAQGQTTEQIAESRSSAVSTVRQQIKSLLQKLGASTQVQAATLAAAAANALVKTPGSSDALMLRHGHIEMAYGDLFRDGRRIGWRRFGQTGGEAVILLHGPFFGAGDFEAEREWAQRLGFDVFAIERPGYGRTERPPLSENVIDTLVKDILWLMDSQSIPEALFLTHDIGLIPALAFALKHPDRIRRILGVSAAPPFSELTQLNAMPPQQRIFIWAAQNAQWLVHLLIRLGMVRMRKLGPNRWVEAVFSEVPGDMAVLNRPEMQPGIISTYSLNTHQAGAGFEVDLQLSCSHWADLVTNTRVPVSLLHGTNNQTTRLAFARILTQMNTGIELTEVEGSGQTLAVERPDLVYRSLRAASQAHT